MDKINNSNLIIIVVLVILAIWAWNHCQSGESFAPPRGASMRSLADNAYSRKQLPDYTEDVTYDLREDYHPHTLCKMQCRYATGNSANRICIDQCISAKTGIQRGVSCSKDSHCAKGDICVMGGAYSGMADRGECMDPREPFQPEKVYAQLHEDEMKGLKLVENFGTPITCNPTDFFDEAAGKCEARFQGPSSAWAVHHQRHIQHPEVWIPGSTTPGYGVGLTDPYDVKTNVTIY